jgi:hypothetical protein
MLVRALAFSVVGQALCRRVHPDPIGQSRCDSSGEVGIVGQSCSQLIQRVESGRNTGAQDLGLECDPLLSHALGRDRAHGIRTRADLGQSGQLDLALDGGRRIRHRGAGSSDLTSLMAATMLVLSVVVRPVRSPEEDPVSQVRICLMSVPTDVIRSLSLV